MTEAVTEPLTEPTTERLRRRDLQKLAAPNRNLSRRSRKMRF